MTTRVDRSIGARVTGNIRKLLKARGWTQEEISKRSDVDKGNLSRYFNGSRDYTLLALSRISEALDVDIVELLKK